MAVKKSLPKVTSFRLQGSDLLADKYQVLSRLGAGWEGEVYLVRERGTRIERTAKIFFPRRNPRDRALRFNARKLHKLRNCPVVIQYRTRDSYLHNGTKVSIMLSDFVEGELLSKFLRRQRGGRLSPFQGIHLLHALASGIECIHSMGEYHGDLHTDNIIVTRFGLGFELKLLDMFQWGPPNAENIQHDVYDMIRIFYDAIGGQRHYARQPGEVKAICRGLKRTLIAQNFRSAGRLTRHLEKMEWL